MIYGLKEHVLSVLEELGGDGATINLQDLIPVPDELMNETVVDIEAEHLNPGIISVRNRLRHKYGAADKVEFRVKNWGGIPWDLENIKVKYKADENNEYIVRSGYPRPDDGELISLVIAQCSFSIPDPDWMHSNYVESDGVLSAIAHELSRKNTGVFVQLPIYIHQPDKEVIQGGNRVFFYKEPDDLDLRGGLFSRNGFTELYWEQVGEDGHFFINLQAAELSLDLWLRHVSTDVRRNVAYPNVFSSIRSALKKNFGISSKRTRLWENQMACDLARFHSKSGDVQYEHDAIKGHRAKYFSKIHAAFVRHVDVEWFLRYEQGCDGYDEIKLLAAQLDEHLKHTAYSSQSVS